MASKSHVIFKKISRDKSVSGTEVSGLGGNYRTIVVSGACSSTNTINIKTLQVQGTLCLVSMSLWDE
jgi:hypothetical protein